MDRPSLLRRRPLVIVVIAALVALVFLRDRLSFDVLAAQAAGIGHDIDHPAVFPVALPEFVIEAYSDIGDVVFEPFGGSGTTMLAAQRTGRVCRSVEIAPEYLDVAIKRFQQNHPDVPVTLLATGQSFDGVASERLATTEVAQ